MSDPVDEFFGKFPQDTQKISRTLRKMAQSAMPGAIEQLYEGQGHVSYQLTPSARGGIVYICPVRDYVRLGFFYGNSLRDPANVLVGTGKRLRHVKVYSVEASHEPVLEQLVRDAWAEGVARVKPAG